MMTWSKEPAKRAAGSYRPLRDYAIVGDCQGAALVARDGGVDWCCLGRFDAEPVFCRMLDANRGGFLEVRPEADHFVARGHRRRAQLGLPLLLAARCGARPLRAGQARLPRGGATLRRVPGRALPSFRARAQNHVRHLRRARSRRAQARPSRRLLPQPPGAGRQRRPDQLQIDLYGKVLEWAHVHVALGGTFDEAGTNRLRGLADHAAAAWREADHGLWEMRSEPRAHVHGKIMSWVALDRAVRLFPDEAERWQEARDAVVEEVRRRGVDPEGGYLLQALDRPGTTDAAVLVAPAVGFPLEEGTLARTVTAVERQLRRGDYVLRYTGDDGLSGEEGCFLLCSFWLIDAWLALGREHEARAMYERLLEQANDVGLYAEQINPATGGFLGNFPQAFTHLGLIGSAINLELFATGGRDALRGGHAERALRRLP